MKSIARILHLPSVVQSKFYDATRILFVIDNTNLLFIFILFFSTIRLLSVSPHHRRAILDITQRMQAAYALLHPPQHKDSLYSFKSKRKYTYNTHPWICIILIVACSEIDLSLGKNGSSSGSDLFSRTSAASDRFCTGITTRKTQKVN